MYLIYTVHIHIIQHTIPIVYAECSVADFFCGYSERILFNLFAISTVATWLAVTNFIYIFVGNHATFLNPIIRLFHNMYVNRLHEHDWKTCKCTSIHIACNISLNRKGILYLLNARRFLLPFQHYVCTKYMYT